MEFSSVSELNSHVSQLINYDDSLRNIVVLGEISNYKLYPSGHHYFSLKDDTSTLKCVMFKGSAFSLKFRPENGMKVIAFGNVSVYERDGVYQLVCTRLQPEGVGDLQLAFEQLKVKLQLEGLFDKPKKILPPYPQKIAVITSPVGAAVRDTIRIIGNRWPLTQVLVVPVRVQGAEAPGEIAEAIDYVNSHALADLIITGRGGGSIEDLWAFNEEIVARAIYRSEIPVISAVGHEPDVTISDYVADRRAATPSNAAEIAVPDKYEIRAGLETLQKRLNPKIYLENKRIDFDRYYERLQYLISQNINQKKHQLVVGSASLDALSPLKVLGRGYSVALKDGKTIKSIKDVSSGDSFSLTVSDGNVNCTVD